MAGGGKGGAGTPQNQGKGMGGIPQNQAMGAQPGAPAPTPPAVQQPNPQTMQAQQNKIQQDYQRFMMQRPGMGYGRFQKFNQPPQISGFTGSAPANATAPYTPATPAVSGPNGPTGSLFSDAEGNATTMTPPAPPPGGTQQTPPSDAENRMMQMQRMMQMRDMRNQMTAMRGGIGGLGKGGGGMPQNQMWGMGRGMMNNGGIVGLATGGMLGAPVSRGGVNYQQMGAIPTAPPIAAPPAAAPAAAPAATTGPKIAWTPNATATGPAGGGSMFSGSKMAPIVAGPAFVPKPQQKIWEPPAEVSTAGKGWKGDTLFYNLFGLPLPKGALDEMSDRQYTDYRMQQQKMGSGSAFRAQPRGGSK